MVADSKKEMLKLQATGMIRQPKRFQWRVQVILFNFFKVF